MIDLNYRKHLWDTGYWEIPDGLDTSSFDFTWRPDPYDRPYIHQFGTQHQKTGGPRFVIPENEGIKYQSHQHAVRLPNPDDRGWRPLVSNSTMDFSWHPDDTEPPFTYVFGNQWYDAEVMSTIQYRVKGATEKKYVDDIKAKLIPIEGDRKYRPLKPNIEFDYSWQPHPHDPPFIYVFGNQWYDSVTMPTLEYRMPGATQKKYVDDIKAILLPDRSKWTIPNDIDDSKFDYSWVPNPSEPPLIYQFGTQWQKTGGPKYITEGATETKYVDTLKAIKLPDMRKWRILEEIDTDKFDFSWHPDDTEPPMMYEFGTQWQPAGGPIYITKGSTQKKYCSDQVAIRIAKEDRCYRPVVSNLQFDYSWHPDPNEPPYIYVFGNQWYDSLTMPTLLYRVKGATEKKYMVDIKVTLTPNKSTWTIPDDIEDDFDYSWLPHPDEPPFIWQFGTQWQKNGGPKYNSPNATVVKHSDLFKATKKNNKENRAYRPLVTNIDFDYSWHPDEDEPPMIYVFGNQWHDAEMMPTLLYRVKDATEKKYVTNVKAKLTEKMDNWVTPDDVDFTVFDYSWCPHPGEPPLIHQFGTQWQRSGGPAYVAPSANIIKYESAIKAVKKPNIRNWRIIEPIDKDTFDFSWHPDSTEENYNHVFGTKFHTPEVLPALMYRGHNDAKNNKYSNDLQADLQIEKVTYEDSIFDSCIEHKFSTAYVHFVKGTSNYIHDLIKSDNISVHLFPSEAIIPKAAVTFFYDKITDYDHVIEHKFEETVEPLDVIFFSNGEACADENYEHLLSLNLPNRIVRIDRINGRVASQHAAANASNTPWYFLVNAKLKVRENFNFNWQPNIYKSRRHYIFTATNSVNGLEYGHQAIVANNKKLTLNTVIRGLDFTMDSTTEVVDLNSGIAIYNSSAWDTWRTAFRECVKLSYDTDDDSKNRLEIWSTIANGEYGEYSIKGAKDAVKYYEEVDGDMDKLMLTYDWEWLYEFYIKYHG